MDAGAYLRKQGWRGEGHSLDHTNRGIRKPLLVSKKVDVLGVGLNKHTSVSDQWWLRAFDDGLKNLGSGKESALAQVQKHGTHRAGLYANFVRGKQLDGSIGNSALLTPDATSGTDTPVKTIPKSEPELCVNSRKRKRPESEDSDSGAQLTAEVADTSADMAKVGRKKGKREGGKERPKAIRARRKAERAEAIKEKRRNEPPKYIDPLRREVEMNRVKIDRRIKQFVNEAQRRGLLPVEPNARASFSGLSKKSGPVNDQPLEPEMAQVFEEAGLYSNPQLADAGKEPTTGKNSRKALKYVRERQKRDLKRVARAYVMSQIPAEVRERDRAYEAEQKAAKKLVRQQEAAEVRREEEEKRIVKLARREHKRAKKAAKRAAKEAQAAEGGVRVDEPDGRGGLNATGRDSQFGGLPEVHGPPLYMPNILWDNILPEKFARYRDRAQEKGVSLEQYILRRKDKAAARA